MLKEFRCKFCHRLLAKVGEGSKVEIKCPKKILERGFVKYDLLKN